MLAVGLVLTSLVVAIALASAAPCTPPPTMGSISLAWSIVDGTGQPATCAQAGAHSVALRLHNRTNGSTIATAFPCTTNPGSTQIAPGLYDIAFDLNAADGTRLTTAPNQAAVAIVAAQVNRLAPVTFNVSIEGTVMLELAAPPTTANCTPATSGGAGITGSAVTLMMTDGRCATVTFERRQNGKQVGTYTVDCGSPAVIACIERNETLTTRLAPRNYVVHVFGKIGALDCWRSDATLGVEPGKTLTQRLDLSRLNNPGC
jgi:hypothetical protein